MVEVNKLLENVNNILSYSSSDKDRDNFFINIYPNLDINLKAKVLDKLQLRIDFFNSYLKSNDKKNIIIKELEKSINVFLENDDLDNCISLFSIVLFYSSINFEFDIKLLLKCFEKILLVFNNYDVMNNQVFENILINMTKIIAYASSTDEYSSIIKNKYYNYFIKLICKYIDKIDNKKIIKSELINLLVETLPSLNSDEIKNKLKNKIEFEIDLKKYENYINNMILINSSIEEFFDDIKRYRIKYNIIPENMYIC